MPLWPEKKKIYTYLTLKEAKQPFQAKKNAKFNSNTAGKPCKDNPHP